MTDPAPMRLVTEAGLPGLLGGSATEAVDAALIARDLLTGEDSRAARLLGTESGYLFVLTDQNNRTAFSIDAAGTVAGKFSLQNGAVTYTSLTSDMASRVVGTGPGYLLQQLDDVSGWAFAITDTAGHVALGVKSDGTLVGKFTLANGVVTYEALDTSLKWAKDRTVALADEAPYVFSVSDNTGRTPLGIRQDGVIEGTITKAQAFAGTPPVVPATDFIETTTDGSSNRQLYRVKRAGGTRVKLTPSGSDHFEPTLTPDGYVLFRQTTAGVTRDRAIPPGSSTIYPAASLLDSVRCFGDSLTLGVGGTGGGYPSRLATLLGGSIPVSNYGIGGQTSDQIASRQGGGAAALQAGITIPAGTTSVALQVGVDMLYASGDPAATATVSIGGISGTLSRAAGTFSSTTSYTFARATAGTATAVASGTKIIFQAATDSESSVQVWFPGRNDLTTTNVLTRVNPDVDLMIGYQKPYAKKYLVLGVTGAVSEVSGSARYVTLMAQNAAAATKYGDSFLDINRYLISNALSIMAANGMTPTSQDTTDLANDVIPTSLHSADGLHFIDVTYQAIAQAIYDTINTKGWLL